MAVSTPALSLERISKHFGALKAVEQVSMQIQQGERRAVIGPNGAGKTTLFHVVSGVLPPTAGAIHVFGNDVTRLPTHRRIRLGMARTFQITNLFRRLTVEHNVYLALQGLTPTKWQMFRPQGSVKELVQQADRLLEEWNLEDRRHALVTELSYGEQRALEIMLAVCQKPKLLLLDEPTAGLSPAETATAAETIRRLPRDISMLLIEHDMDVVFDLCDTMTVMHLGEVLATGDPASVRGNPQVQEIYLGEAIEA
ncbi:MAG TPA: ABC transporter ATP-binding protein [Chloroflexota bacterium]|nr:ABC transporter ATP-binding protein [Chloroflexota bacterium]